jgi:pyruvyltransferase
MWGKLPGQFDTRGMTDAIVDCIRGRYSRSFWHLPDSVPIGDPGLLTPFLYRQPEPSRERLFTFIPHFQHERYFLNTFPIDGFHPRVCKYVSPQNDVDIVVEEIQRGEVVISSSLHGLIVAESFGIPTVWIMPDPLEKSADRFNIIMKYGDYYSAFPSGVKRIPVFPRPGWRQKDFENLAREAKYVSSFDIYEVRKGLIESFPYELWKA